jgi:hypothetical protein
MVLGLQLLQVHVVRLVVLPPGAEACAEASSATDACTTSAGYGGADDFWAGQERDRPTPRTSGMGRCAGRNDLSELGGDGADTPGGDRAALSRPVTDFSRPEFWQAFYQRRSGGSGSSERGAEADGRAFEWFVSTQQALDTIEAVLQSNELWRELSLQRRRDDAGGVRPRRRRTLHRCCKETAADAGRW